MKERPQVIAIEEHYFDAAIVAHYDEATSRETIRGNPTHFAGFATLPTPDPKAAADELERSVTQLGLKGAMIHSLTNGLFIDDKRLPLCAEDRAKILKQLLRM